jgi:hypothetical protein
MADRKPQSFENHTRLVPLYHMVAFGILVINLLYRLYRVFTDLSVETLVTGLVAVALILLFFYARIFALTAQDRVIRLEMLLRFERLLPPELRARAKDFTVDQLVALRFASDEELPELARKVLTDNIRERRAIKKMVRNWQADYLRV